MKPGAAALSAIVQFAFVTTVGSLPMQVFAQAGPAGTDGGVLDAAAASPSPPDASDGGAQEPRSSEPVSSHPSRPPPMPEPTLDLSSNVLDLPPMMVVGEAPEDLDSVPGAAHVLRLSQLRQSAPVTANEALRRVPGVVVREEEGLGLRANIGFRGLSPDRSRNLLVLEDGAPIQMMPYGEPELYYTPRIERMRTVEVVKGSSSILFGPRTIGGVLNFVTLDPPEKLTVTADARYGSYGYGLGELSVGDTVGDVGYLVYGLHNRFDGPRDFDIRITDLMAKITVNMHKSGMLRFKVQAYDEASGTTYLGLTLPQYEADASSNFAQNDKFTIHRYALTATHSIHLAPFARLQTIVYGFDLVRNWRRQDYDRRDLRGDPPLFEYERVISGTGDVVSADMASNDGSSIFFRHSTGNRNRSFRVGGIESRATIDFSAWGEDHEVTGGARLHYEVADEQRVNGTTASASSGVIFAQENRSGTALAAYLMTRLSFLRGRLKMTPGVRIENLWTERTIYRDQGVDFGQPASGDDFLFALMPGVGATWEFVNDWTAFAGVHRGFAPPRTKDNLTPTGAVLQLPAEYSWNFELGGRYTREDWLTAELTGFVLDFSNEILTLSEASGEGSDTGGTNAGPTLHLGAEAAVSVDAAKFARWDFGLPIQLSYTFVRARFRSNEWPEEVRGNVVPYAPQHVLSVDLGFKHPWGLEASVHGDYVGAQYSDPQNTVEASADGLHGRIAGRFLLDTRVAFTFSSPRITLYVLAKNLLDERYVASRAPAGIQPGMFRQLLAGVRGEF